MAQVVGVAAMVGGVVLVVVVGTLAVGQYRFIVRLRNEHPEAWRSLGSPSPLLARLEHVAAVHRYLKEREYRSLPDEALVATAERLRALSNAAYGLGAGVLVLIALAKAIK